MKPLLIFLFLISNLASAASQDCQKATALKALFHGSQALRNLPVEQSLRSISEGGEWLRSDIASTQFRRLALRAQQDKLVEMAQDLIDGAAEVSQSETCQLFLQRREKEEGVKLGRTVDQLLIRVDKVQTSLEKLEREACL